MSKHDKTRKQNDKKQLKVIDLDQLGQASGGFFEGGGGDIFSAWGGGGWGGGWGGGTWE